MRTWWGDVLGPNGLPRFYGFSTSTKREHYRRIIVVELKPDAVELPLGWPDSRTIKCLLLRTEPLYWDGKRATRVWERAERVLDRLSSMPLSIMAVEQKRGGVHKLFDKLWLEDVEQFDEIYPRRSLRRA